MTPILSLIPPRSPIIPGKNRLCSILIPTTRVHSPIRRNSCTPRTFATVRMVNRAHCPHLQLSRRRPYEYTRCRNVVRRKKNSDLHILKLCKDKILKKYERKTKAFDDDVSRRLLFIIQTIYGLKQS